MEAVNSDADFLPRQAPQIASGFHDAAKILLTPSPVWTPTTTAVDRGAVGHVVASWPTTRQVTLDFNDTSVTAETG
jgi:hypothetical protein